MTRFSIPVALALCLGVTSLAPAATILGNLYFTTFQNQGSGGTTNVWSVAFIYDDTVPILCLGSTTLVAGTPPTCPGGSPPALATLLGADGLIFDPNNPNKLLVGEQTANKVASVGTTGLPISEVLADGTGTNPYAFGVVAHPNKTQLLAFVNTNVNIINVVPLPIDPLTPGRSHLVTSGDSFIRGVDFFPDGTAFYGDDPDGVLIGHFGRLDLTNINVAGGTFSTTRSTIVDLTTPGCGLICQGQLPSHGLTYDPFSNCMILSSGSEIWQLCPDSASTDTFNIRAKLSLPGGNWDQTSVDGKGHLFAANNNGDLLFVDYSANLTLSIADHKYISQQFLMSFLDDIANGGGAGAGQGPPPSLEGRMTGGGSVFTAGGARVTHGFELHCDTLDVPNRLEINWPGHRFHLESLISATCSLDPSINARHPKRLQYLRGNRYRETRRRARSDGYLDLHRRR